MKKFLCLLLSFVMVLSIFTACGDDKKKDGSGETDAVANTEKNVNIFMTSELNSVIYSRKKYYLTDLNSILWSIAENGKELWSFKALGFILPRLLPSCCSPVDRLTSLEVKWRQKYSKFRVIRIIKCL